jgi:hypothetical protein
MLVTVKMLNIRNVARKVMATGAVVIMIIIIIIIYLVFTNFLIGSQV